MITTIKAPGNNPDGVELPSNELEMLRNNKLHGYNFRERKYKDWTENYEFYRDKVIYNRLTQRQSVNLPLMKKSLRTILRYVDNMPVLQFENLDNDKTAELFKNEYWKWTVEQNKMEMQDVIDKKQVLLFGRSFDQWQVIDGKVVMTVQDPEDILVSRYTEPHNIHSSRFLIHTHIFVPLSTLQQNTGYDQEAVKRLQDWHREKMGLIKSTDNFDMLTQKQTKMADMGVTDAHEPVLGETYIELSLHFVFREVNGKSHIYLYVEADNQEILMKKPLEEVIGVTKDHYFQTHYPYVSWADDLERQDFWSDSVADVLRQPNKVINSWYAQLVENRTMRNFNMHYFNSSLEGFTPQSYSPVPWGWYGIPVPAGKNISDVLQNVEIPELTNTKADIEFIEGMVNETTGASSVLQGTPTPGRVPLGVTEMVAQKSQERIKDMAKFYNQAWLERGEMFIKLLEAAGDKIDAVKIYKKGRNTSNIYMREIGPEDWKSKAGYRCKVWSQEDKNSKDSASIQKMQLAKANMPMNQKLNEVLNRKLLEFSDLPADEVKAILDEEEMRLQQLAMNPMGVQPGQATPPGQIPAVAGQMVKPTNQVKSSNLQA